MGGTACSSMDPAGGEEFVTRASAEILSLLSMHSGPPRWSVSDVGQLCFFAIARGAGVASGALWLSSERFA
jgi:hypothetical protein